MPPYVSWPSGFDIAPAKITRYLLNTAGKSPSKARWWLSQGYSLTRPTILADHLYEHTSTTNFAGLSIPEPYWGLCYIFEGLIATPNGGAPWIRTVWQIEYGTPMGLAGVAKLLTAHRLT